jgi:hypothetical protein
MSIFSFTLFLFFSIFYNSMEWSRYRVPTKLSQEVKAKIAMQEMMEYMKDCPFLYRNMNLQDFRNRLQTKIPEEEV